MINVETPASRATDPRTSHLAEREMNATGKRRDQRDLVTRAVRKWPGLTGQELALMTSKFPAVAWMDRYVFGRRLPECVTAGSVRKGAARQCKVTQRLATTWWPA